MTCLAIIKSVGINLPEMYKLGYKNNNCIGCVKGGMGYWNKIRKDFPDVFNRMAKLEREKNIYLISIPGKDGREIVWLDELDPSRGRYREEHISCGILCDELTKRWEK